MVAQVELLEGNQEGPLADLVEVTATMMDPRSPRPNMASVMMFSRKLMSSSKPSFPLCLSESTSLMILSFLLKWMEKSPPFIAGIVEGSARAKVPTKPLITRDPTSSLMLDLLPLEARIQPQLALRLHLLPSALEGRILSLLELPLWEWWLLSQWHLLSLASLRD